MLFSDVFSKIDIASKFRVFAFWSSAAVEMTRVCRLDPLLTRARLGPLSTRVCRLDPLLTRARLGPLSTSVDRLDPLLTSVDRLDPLLTLFSMVFSLDVLRLWSNERRELNSRRWVSMRKGQGR